MNVISCKTDKITPLNGQVYQVRIIPETKFEFISGQYLLLMMPDGKKIPLSIASAAEEKSFIELHIRLLSDTGLPAEMLRLFQGNAPFQIEGPHGRCYLKESKNNIVIIAGGTGFAPMKSLIESALNNGFKRQLSLYLGAQSSKDFYLNASIEKLSSRNENFSFIPVINQAESNWQGHVGFPHEVALKRLADKVAEHDFYISGSEAMVLSVYHALKQAGVPSDKIHSDIINIKKDMGEDL